VVCDDLKIYFVHIYRVLTIEASIETQLARVAWSRIKISIIDDDTHHGLRSYIDI
jgi:hypothetical protein